MNLPLNFKDLFSLSRLIDWRPSVSQEALLVFLFGFAVLLLIAVAVKIVEKRKKLAGWDKKLAKKYFNLFLIIGLLGLFWTWCRYEKAAYLSARLWFWVLILAFLGWLAWIVRCQIKVAPAARKKLAQKQIFEKYLPKKK